MGPFPESLEQLAQRAAQGDRRALQAIYERTAGALVREVIGPIVCDRAGCEDVLRETFLVALQKPEALAGGEVFPWLATIARNKSIDHRRRKASEGRFREQLARELEAAEREQGDPETEVAAAQARQRRRESIEAVFSKMNPRYAQAVRLRLLEERTREECARLLDVRVATFDVLLFRACKQFQSLYVETYGSHAEVAP